MIVYFAKVSDDRWTKPPTTPDTKDHRADTLLLTYEKNGKKSACFIFHSWTSLLLINHKVVYICKY